MCPLSVARASRSDSSLVTISVATVTGFASFASLPRSSSVLSDGEDQDVLEDHLETNGAWSCASS
jgi:hypothetical protein